MQVLPQRVGGRAWDSAFLTSSQEMLMLLIPVAQVLKPRPFFLLPPSLPSPVSKSRSSRCDVP